MTNKKPTILSCFVTKGGVSKTTTSFSLGWAYADLGFKVMLVDGDAQCNLTNVCLGLDDDEIFSKVYHEKEKKGDLYKAAQHGIAGKLKLVGPADLWDTENPNMKLLAGNSMINDFEKKLGTAIMAGHVMSNMQIVGVLGEVIRQTAAKYDIDIVIIDTNPSISSLNQCLIMGSDHLIVPVTPDGFCLQAIHTIADVLPKWYEECAKFRDAEELEFPLPLNPPKFLGVVQQRFSKRAGKPSGSFEAWITKINDAVNDALYPELKKINMTVMKTAFKDETGKTPFNLAQISDFNALAPLSHELNRPVFALLGEHMNQTGTARENMFDTQDDFRDLFFDLARTTLTLMGLEQTESMMFYNNKVELEYWEDRLLYTPQTINKRKEGAEDNKPENMVREKNLRWEPVTNKIEALKKRKKST